MRTMANQSIDDYEILCIACGRVIDEDQVHIITAGPVAPDFDVLCPECYQRYCDALNTTSPLADFED